MARYGEVILRVGDAFYQPLLFSRGGLCRGVSIRVKKCMERQPGRKIVAVVERWPLVEVRL